MEKTMHKKIHLFAYSINDRCFEEKYWRIKEEITMKVKGRLQCQEKVALHEDLNKTMGEDM